MTPAEGQGIQDHRSRLFDLDAGGRDACLAKVASGIRQELEALLATDGRHATRLESGASPATANAWTAAASCWAGRQVGGMAAENRGALR